MGVPILLLLNTWLELQEGDTIVVRSCRLHILAVGNVTVAGSYEGDYGNPFVLNLCPGGGMVDTRDSKSLAR